MTYCNAVLIEWSSEFGGGSIGCHLQQGHGGAHAAETQTDTVAWWDDSEPERAIPSVVTALNDGRTA
jgi:hypothetical protein